MTTYSPAEVERLIATVRKRYASSGVAWVGESLDMADQLEAARARIAELQDGLRAALKCVTTNYDPGEDEIARLRALAYPPTPC